MAKQNQKIIASVIRESIKNRRRVKKTAGSRTINENYFQNPAGAPFLFIDDEDFVNELTKYTYDIFEQDKYLVKLEEYVDDIKFSDRATVSITLRRNADGKWVIVVNPNFVKYLLESMVSIYEDDEYGIEPEDWDYNPNDNEWPDMYFLLFRMALLWAAYVGLVFDTTRNPDGELAYKTNPRSTIRKAESEMVKNYPDYHDELVKFIELKNRYANEHKNDAVL